MDSKQTAKYLKRAADINNEIISLRSINADLLAALQFILDDLNTELDYEAGIIARAAIARATQ